MATGQHGEGELGAVAPFGTDSGTAVAPIPTVVPMVVADTSTSRATERLARRVERREKVKGKYVRSHGLEMEKEK